MPYSYIEEIVTSDAAFRAWGQTLEETFISAFDATTNLMVDDLESITKNEVRVIELNDRSEEMLLFKILQELIYLKDAFCLVLRLQKASIEKKEGLFIFRGEAAGEMIDNTKHRLAVDVKAVTLHLFSVRKTDSGWEAMVVLDI